MCLVVLYLNSSMIPVCCWSYEDWRYTLTIQVPDPPSLQFLIQGLIAVAVAASVSTVRWYGVRGQYLVEALCHIRIMA